MAYWRLFYHIVWATKDRLPLITEIIEPELHKILLAKCKEVGGLGIVVNGMPDHVHMIVAVPPTIALSDVVKNLKGTSSRFVHTAFQTPFEWQKGYGIFSVSPSPKNLQKAVDYVKRQKEHHSNDTTYADLERYSVNDDGPTIMPVT